MWLVRITEKRMFVLSWYTAFVARVEPSSFPTEQLSPIVSKPKNFNLMMNELQNCDHGKGTNKPPSGKMLHAGKGNYNNRTLKKQWIFAEKT